MNSLCKTQVWPACDQLERRARVSDPEASVWKGVRSPQPNKESAFRHSPLGHPDFVHTCLENVLNEYGVLSLRQWTCQSPVESCQARCGAELRCGAHERRNMVGS